MLSRVHAAAHPYLRAGDLVRLAGGLPGAIEARVAAVTHNHQPEHEEAAR